MWQQVFVNHACGQVFNSCCKEGPEAGIDTHECVAMPSGIQPEL